MKAKLVFLLIFMGWVAFGFWLKDYIIPVTRNYHITIEIETPEGIKSGSAVRQIVISNRFALNPDISPVYYNVRGEAVIIDLGDRGYVFVLVGRGPEEFRSAFPYRSNDLREVIKYYNNLENGAQAVLEKSHPRLVMFDDLNDPMTVKGIDRLKMDEVLGEGVTFKRATIEITDDPMTTGIENMLPWLKNLKANLDGTSGTFSNKLSNTLHVGNFRRGM